MALPCNASCTDEKFISLWRQHQSATAVAKELGIAARNVTARRRTIEKRHGIFLPTLDLRRPAYNTAAIQARFDPPLMHIGIKDGCILVFGDAHYHPSYPSWTCHRALVHLAKKWKPQYVVANGDIFDFPGISRHHRIGWEAHPTVKQELECVQDRLGEIEKASGAKLIRVWGNHDLRFEGKLSNILPQYEGVAGMSLKDHIPQWKACWAVRVNQDELQISHRWKGGIHSPHNNTKDAGISYCTGHDHFPRVDPWADIRGLRFGVNHGALADLYEEDGSMTSPFFYTEQRPTHWWSAFAKLTFKGGRLLEPQLVRKVDANTVQFAGELISV